MASVPLVGLEQAAGSTLSALAGLLLAVALAEPLVHRLQDGIEGRNQAKRQRAVAEDVLRATAIPVWNMATVSIDGFAFSEYPATIAASELLEVLDETEEALRDAETGGAARDNRGLDPLATDEQAKEIGLPTAYYRWSCCDVIARALAEVRDDVTMRMHAVGVDEKLGEALRELCFSLQVDWQLQADLGQPRDEAVGQFSSDPARFTDAVTPGAFLHVAADTLKVCRSALGRIEVSSVLNVPLRARPARKPYDFYLTTHDLVAKERERLRRRT